MVRKLLHDLYFPLKEQWSASKKVKVALLEPNVYYVSSEIQCGITFELGGKNFDKDPFFTPYNAYGYEDNMYEIMNDVTLQNYKLIVAIGDQFAQIAHEMIRHYRVNQPLVYVSTNGQGITPQKSDISTSGIITNDHRYEEHLSHMIEIFPHARTVAVLYDPIARGGQTLFDFEKVATQFAQRGVTVLPFYLSNETKDLESLTGFIQEKRPEVLFSMYDVTVMSKIKEIIEIASELRIPLFSADGTSAHAGAAFSCGNDGIDIGYTLSYHIYRFLSDGVPLHELPVINYNKKYVLRVNSMALETQCPNLSNAGRKWIARHAELV